MSFRVHLQPSGREFLIEPHETVLDAGLRSGVNLKYSCASGTCGECKARIVAGRLGESRFSDYVVGEAEKLRGYALLCCTTAASDLVIEASEAIDTGDIPVQRLTARIAKLERRGEDYLLLHLRTPRTQTLRFLAGQYVRLQFANLPARALAVASCPCNGMVLQFHLRCDRADPVGRRVLRDLKVADAVEIEGPYGEFTLDEAARRPLMMLALDTGFAPVKSLIEHAIALELPQPIHLCWVASHAGAHYLANYCRAWEDALDGFRFTPLVWEQAAGAVTLESLARQVALAVPGNASFDLYASAPPPLTEAVLAACEARGRRPARVVVDALDPG